MVYIGSMNLDPRSETTNTELGIVAQSPELAHDVIRVIDADQAAERLPPAVRPGRRAPGVAGHGAIRPRRSSN